MCWYALCRWPLMMAFYIVAQRLKSQCLISIRWWTLHEQLKIIMTWTCLWSTHTHTPGPERKKNFPLWPLCACLLFHRKMIFFFAVVNMNSRFVFVRIFFFHFQYNHFTFYLISLHAYWTRARPIHFGPLDANNNNEFLVRIPYQCGQSAITSHHTHKLHHHYYRIYGPHPSITHRSQRTKWQTKEEKTKDARVSRLLTYCYVNAWKKNRKSNTHRQHAKIFRIGTAFLLTAINSNRSVTIIIIIIIIGSLSLLCCVSLFPNVKRKQRRKHKNNSWIDGAIKTN